MASQRSSEISPTPDSEQLFVRAWALRSPEHENSSTRGSSPISPRTIRSRSRETRPSHRKAYSEASVSQQDDRTDGVTVLATSAAFTSSFIRLPTLGTVRPPDTGDPELCRPRRSSISERARRLLRISSSWKTSNAILDTETDEDTRPLLKSKREITGRWIEVRIGRKSKSDEHSRTGSEDSVALSPDAALGVGLQKKEGLREVTSPIVDVDQIPKNAKPLYSSRKGGLYSRARRRLGLQQNSEESVQNAARDSTLTLDVLERVSSILRDVADTAESSPDRATSDSSQSISTLHWPRTRKKPFPHRATFSSSSSIPKLTMGIVPRNSPDAKAMYTGSDGKQHIAVEMASPDGPTYLPSEARRIGTPPLPSSSIGLQRGFFFDDNPWPECEPSPDIEGHSGQQQHQPHAHANIDWHQARAAAAKAKEAQFQFELNVPEHLPNSPLCPKHPKNHRTRGNGVCVYHGRRASRSGLPKASKSEEI